MNPLSGDRRSLVTNRLSPDDWRIQPFIDHHRRRRRRRLFSMSQKTHQAVEESSATLSSEWAPGPVKAGSVYRFSVSSRRKPYVDLLVASDKAKKETEVQVAGFSGEKNRRIGGGGVMGNMSGGYGRETEVQIAESSGLRK